MWLWQRQVSGGCGRDRLLVGVADTYTGVCRTDRFLMGVVDKRQVSLLVGVEDKR